MATTTNYGWTTPDDTALVKDGASAIRTLGSSVDTTTKSLNPETTLGDIAYRSSTANVKTRLGIGTTGQVLTVAGGVPSWATPGASVPANSVVFVSTSQSTTSTSFTDLATSQALTLTTGTKVLIIMSAEVNVGATTNKARFGFAVSGATTLAASETNNMVIQGNNSAASNNQVSNSFILTGLTAGSNTFTAKFMSSLGDSVTFAKRFLSVIDMGS